MQLLTVKKARQEIGTVMEQLSKVVSLLILKVLKEVGALMAPLKHAMKEIGE